jgi:hypothetical protein
MAAVRSSASSASIIDEPASMAWVRFSEPSPVEVGVGPGETG